MAVKKILLAGYIGCGNIGDDAMALGLLHGLEDEPIDIAVLSGNPDATFSNYRLHSIPRMDMGLVDKAIEACDALVFPGGSIFQDLTSVRSVAYYWRLVKRAKKHGKSHFGYKLHASVDKRHKLIRKVIITDAAVADTCIFEDLLDPNNTSRDVYADRGYPSARREADLNQAGWRVHIQRKGTATKAISATQKQRNRGIATPRARVEHVFGALAQMGGKLVRCIGIVRTRFALNLKVASYNLKRMVFLKERGLAAF